MAIIIPSKNIYAKQNPKVRDNVIERIEVGAVDIVPNNEYETPVYNEKFLIKNDLLEDTQIANSDTDGSYWGASAGGVSATRISGSYVGYLNQKTFNVTVQIPVIEKNKYIKYLQTKVDKNGNENIKYSLFGIIKQGTATAQWKYKAVATVAQITEGDISYSNPTSVSEEKSIDFPNEISISEYSDSAGQVGSSAKQSLIPWGNIKTAEAIEKTNYYEINLEIMAGLTVVKMTSYSFTNGNSDTYLPPSTLSFSGDYEIFEPTSIEITFYGNTIGIDLTDKTVYINGETAKKVHSVDGNELMQTSNYIMGENSTKTKALDKMFGDTQIDYARGKETATIRCSISDYYDGDQKVIAIDNSTGKMSFDISDRVIPMVYGADGEDRPMSTYQDGSPKVFQVLGSNIYYDGAVWQELSLQEVDKSEIM